MTSHHPPHSPAFLERVAAAKTRIRETNIDFVEKEVLPKIPELQNQSISSRPEIPFVLVDVREDNEFAAGFIPGAIHIGKGVIERDIEIKIPDKSQTIVLYCGGGYRSAIAAESIQQMGYCNVLSMDGGYRGWVEKALPRAKLENEILKIF